MTRLHPKAYDLLVAEVRRLTAGDATLAVQRELVLKRLQRLRNQTGEPATVAEIQAAVDLLPNFDPQVIARAARLNRPPSPVAGCLGQMAIAGGVLAAVVGGVWLANLPYPMIRWPVAKVAPLVLLPSFMEMDHHYRQAISLVEQSDQLINQATGAADIELGKEKVQAAQKSLDHLPVWFLGYYPQRYCTMFECSWQFTYDEFETARKQIGRMDAKVFQEEQAIAQYETAQVNLENAKSLAAIGADQREAIALWQGALDDLSQLPPQTLAGRLAQTQLVAETRDFQQLAGNLAGQSQTATRLDAAKSYADLAVKTAQNAPHPPEVWQKAIDQWEAAIAQLHNIPSDNPSYVEAQALKARYQDNLGTIKIRLQQEQQSQRAFQAAQRDYTQVLGTDYGDRPRQYRSELQHILNQLQGVQSDTTVTSGAIAMQQELRDMLKQLN